MSDTSDGAASEGAWIESRPGGLFFVNALLVTPAAVVLLPLLLDTLLRAGGLVHGPSPMLDTIPLVGAYVAPWVGWLAAPAAWFAWRTLGEVARPAPRFWLRVFAVLHVAVVFYTVWRWTGGGA